MFLTKKNSQWQLLSTKVITVISFNPADRLLLLAEIAQYVEQKIYFWNMGYEYLQSVCIDRSQTEHKVSLSSSSHQVGNNNIIEVCQKINDSAVFVLEGLGKIDSLLDYQLRNFFFSSKLDLSKLHQLILLDSVVQIPLELQSMVETLQYPNPNLSEIIDFLEFNFQLKDCKLAQSCVGLSLGEIVLLLENQSNRQQIIDYKIKKLARRGLRIVPEPDIEDVGGLDLLERDLQKIQKLFTKDAAIRKLRPPKGCLLWGLPGTGKSLVAKLMTKKLDATLISCDWNQLFDSDLATSLANLQYILDVVDNIGNCVLFFDEFEKAFSGWDSQINGGILVKMAGKLLTWLQDHESPSIMLCTINRLEMLPPELIRRFQYIWFFDSNLHNGAMHEIFQLHLQKHFPNFHQHFNDTQWQQLFLHYRGCSPDEIAKAIQRTHDEIFFKNLHYSLDYHTLLEELLNERTKFQPAIKNKSTSNALAKIRQYAEFARPVRGKDTSQFAVKTKRLFETDEIMLDEHEILFSKLVALENNGGYSAVF